MSDEAIRQEVHDFWYSNGDAYPKSLATEDQIDLFLKRNIVIPHVPVPRRKEATMQAKIELGFRGHCPSCNESSPFGSWKDAHEWMTAHNKTNHKEKR